MQQLMTENEIAEMLKMSTRRSERHARPAHLRMSASAAWSGIGSRMCASLSPTPSSRMTTSRPTEYQHAVATRAAS